MALRKQSTVNGHFPELWRGEARTLPGGFKLLQTFGIGTIIRVATPVQVFFDNLTAAIVKTGIVLNGGTTKNPRVAKDHLFAINDYVSKAGGMTAAPKITAIDTTNPEYDVLTLNTAYTGLTEGDILVEVAEGLVESKAVQKYTPTHVLSATKEIKDIGHNTVDVAYDCIVLTPCTQNPIVADWLTEAGCLKENHSIKFIKQ